MNCKRCSGTGVMLEYLYHKGGECFRCRGTGQDPKGSGFTGQKPVHREVVIGGHKLVMVPETDMQGRFMGYNVYIEGMPHSLVACRNFKEAIKAFHGIKEKLKTEKAIR